MRESMEEKGQIKTIRFTSSELNKIILFLEKNPGMDFSTLVRISTNTFIENPKLNQVSINLESKEKKIWN